MGSRGRQRGRAEGSSEGLRGGGEGRGVHGKGGNRERSNEGAEEERGRGRGTWQSKGSDKRAKGELEAGYMTDQGGKGKKVKGQTKGRRRRSDGSSEGGDREG